MNKGEISISDFYKTIMYCREANDDNKMKQDAAYIQ